MTYKMTQRDIRRVSTQSDSPDDLTDNLLAMVMGAVLTLNDLSRLGHTAVEVNAELTGYLADVLNRGVLIRLYHDGGDDWSMKPDGTFDAYDNDDGAGAGDDDFFDTSTTAHLPYKRPVA